MGIFLLVWLALCIVAAAIANGKGRSGAGFFLLSFFFSPLIGIICALVAGSDVSLLEEQGIASGERKRCPYCDEVIQRRAVVCRYCQKALSDEHIASREVALAVKPSDRETFLHDKGETTGPFTSEELVAMLKSGRVTPEALFWQNEDTGWQSSFSR